MIVQIKLLYKATLENKLKSYEHDLYKLIYVL